MKSGSSRGILNDDFVKLKAKEEIKQSTVRALDKTVITWTPVVLGSSSNQVVEKTKLEYNSGSALNSGMVPPITKKLKGGAIIRLPVDDTGSEVQEAVQV